MEDLVSIGFTKKSHGFRGEIKMNVKDEFVEDFLNAEVVFIEISGRTAPFFIENVRYSGHTLLSKFEDIDSPEAALPLTSKPVFLRRSDLIPESEKLLEVSENALSFARLQGFTLIDSDFGKVGPIKEVVEYPQQEMALVRFGEKELLIPLHKDLIVSIDESAKEIKMTLPEGLLDL
ncbi:MAG: 16S rRNA processing protein RimM [Bacteroidetes bacterium]|nr:MAG: 16S rRNA processing protein RimM [Bacteroidota bacterium]